MRAVEESDGMDDYTFSKWDPRTERDVCEAPTPAPGRTHPLAMDVSSGVSTESDDCTQLSTRSLDSVPRNALLTVKSRLEHLVAHVSGPSCVVERSNDKDPYFSLISDESAAFAKRQHTIANAAKLVPAAMVLLTDGAAYLNRIGGDDASGAAAGTAGVPLTHLEQLALGDGGTTLLEGPDGRLRAPRRSALAQSLEFARPSAVTSLFILHMYEALLRKDIEQQERDESYALLLLYHVESVRELRRHREAAAVRLERFARMADEATRAASLKFSIVLMDLETRHRAAIDERRSSDCKSFLERCHELWVQLRSDATAAAALRDVSRAEDGARSVLVTEFTASLVQLVSRMEESRMSVNLRSTQTSMQQVGFDTPPPFLNAEQTRHGEVAARISARMQALQLRLARSSVLEPSSLQVVEADEDAVPQRRSGAAAAPAPTVVAVVDKRRSHDTALSVDASTAVRACSASHRLQARTRTGAPQDKKALRDRRAAPEATKRNRNPEGARFATSGSPVDVPEAPRELNPDADRSAASSSERLLRSPGRPFAELLSEALQRNLDRSPEPVSDGGSPKAAAVEGATCGAAGHSVSERDAIEDGDDVPTTQIPLPSSTGPRGKCLVGTSHTQQAATKVSPGLKAKAQPLTSAVTRVAVAGIRTEHSETAEKRRPVGQHMSAVPDGSGATPEPSLFRTNKTSSAREGTVAMPSLHPATSTRASAAPPKKVSTGGATPLPSRLTAPSFVVEKDECPDVLDAGEVLPRWQAAAVGEASLRAEVTQMFLRVRSTLSHLYRDRPGAAAASPHGWLLRGTSSGSSSSSSGTPSCERRFVALTRSGALCVCLADDPFRPRRKTDEMPASPAPIEWQTLFFLEDVVRVVEDKERDGGGTSAFGFHVDVAAHLGPALEDVGVKRFRFWSFSKRDRATWVLAVQQGSACARNWELDGLVEVAPLMRMLSAVKPHLLTNARESHEVPHASPDQRQSQPGRRST